MPEFSPDVDDLRIEPDEFMDECNVREIGDVIRWLERNEYIKINDVWTDNRCGYDESLLREYLLAIRDSYHQLSSEEIEQIVKIGKKFK